MPVPKTNGVLVSVERTPPPGVAVYLYSVALAVAAGAMLSVLLKSGDSPGPATSLAALSAMALMAERQSIPLNGTTQLSVAFLPIVFAAVAFGPVGAMVVGVASLLGDFGAPHVRWAIWTSSRAIIGAASGLVALSFASVDARNFGWAVVAVAAAVVTEACVDFFLVVTTLIVRGTGSLRAASRAIGPILLASVPLYTPVIAVLFYAYQTLSAWAILLFLLPLLAAQRLFVLYREQRETAEKLSTVNIRLERANLSFATALVATLDARDRYTAGHSTAVALYTRDIAAYLRLDQECQALAELCGLVHDIGKIGLPPGLLEKTGPLTLDERRAMERHSEIGERILKNVEDYGEIAKIVRHHHERVDGKGYPNGLELNEIPLLSRIIAVADAYDAMTSHRPYRDAMPPTLARQRLARASGTQFDPVVVAAFDAVLARASENYRVGNRSHPSSRPLARHPVAAAG